MMVQEPEELLIKRPPAYSPAPIQEKPVLKSDKSDTTNKETGIRKLLNRKQSITRGTASSLAKVVRINNNGEKSPPSDTIRRKFSLRNRKQSLTEPKRRSSWSVFNTPQAVPDSSPPPLRKKSNAEVQQEAARVDAPTTAENQQNSSLETPSDTPDAVIADESVDIHTHNHGEDDLPGYMRRPICAACTRNVKITSSSETNNLKSTSSTMSSSRRSSFSTTTTKSQQSLVNSFQKPEGFQKPLTPQTSESIQRKDVVQSPEGLDRAISIEKLEETSSEEVSPTQTVTNIPSKSQEPSTTESMTNIDKFQQQLEPRSHSPTSPIPTRRANDTKDVWCKLLLQQQRLLSSLAPSLDDDDDKDMMMIQQSISKLLASEQEPYETLLLETQTKVLQKFASMMHQQQQQQQTNVIESPAMEQVPAPPVPFVASTWQTDLEYSFARWKWGISHWTGIKVGSGTIEALDYDSLGYPENVMISGVCVTIEPGLLPKGLQKYFKPYEDLNQVACHKYAMQLTREKRLSMFQMKPRDDWVADEQVKGCEFVIKHNGRTKTCHVQFGVFDRKHHCRRCGHIFCYVHSSNELPLFISSGEERGEWARVCDSCFYSCIDPQCISKS